MPRTQAVGTCACACVALHARARGVVFGGGHRGQPSAQPAAQLDAQLDAQLALQFGVQLALQLVVQAAKAVCGEVWRGAGSQPTARTFEAFGAAKQQVCAVRF